MNKIAIIIILIAVLILGSGAYLLTKQAKPIDIPQKEAETYEYFWGNGCPHCATVAEFFDSSDKDEKVKLIKYEVWYDKTNAKIMEDRFSKCSPKPESVMSVPLLITPDGQCLMGDQPIIELFKSF